ncbi:Putative BTB/POZ domain-containing protein [Septoria linicola]|uniref:BTB/POZ domain-containing protein n=1 Tax=Septoria linicola TaxID=215465 RepID=A0A9Q9ATX5_9PEZI|nr:putative BTB/POZ domain-containing protein [Septoria linicola]USW51876.1 Putative BTB/POZ domain-containing protein [Septoria linicola]
MAPPSTSDKCPPSSAFDQNIQIKVGAEPEIRTFPVHKGILVFYSGYFEGALRPTSAFSEAATGIVDFSDEDPAIVERFVHWLYVRKGALNAEDYDGDFFMDMLCDLWVFADRRQVPLLMNDTVDTMRDEIVRTWTIPTRQLSYLYENHTADSNMRRFCFEVVGKAGVTGLLTNKKRSVYNKHVLWELLKVAWNRELQDYWRKEDVQALELCPRYHHHEEGMTCKKP